MLKLFFSSLTIISLSFLFSCGPAAEDRQTMHARAKVFQDSIANMIRAQMAEAESVPPLIFQAPQPAASPVPQQNK